MQRILSTVNAPNAEGGAGGGGSLPTHVSQHGHNQDHEHHLRHKASKASNASIRSRSSASGRQLTSQHSSHQYPQRNPSLTRRTSQGPGNFTQAMYTPIVESVDQAMRSTNQGSGVLQLPQQITTEDFARVVTVATVSALRQQQLQTNMSPARHPNRPNASGGGGGHHEADPSGGGGEASGHGAPSWSRTTSALVLLGCTVLYALIAGEHSLTLC
jgi:Ca2+:H+ antiporter